MRETIRQVASAELPTEWGRFQVSRQSVSRWYEAWRSDQPRWIGGSGRAGRRPRLDEVLRRGAPAHGFSTDPPMLPQIAAVIERITGVHYHPCHVWKILAAMEWSLQRPAR